MRRKKVSVIIPFYNREDYLADAIESVLNTNYAKLEIILVDDGSRDGSRQIADSFSERSPEILRVVSHPHRRNKGIASSRNLGILESNGAYISFLDSDDTYLPNRFDSCIRWLDQHDEIDGVYERLEVQKETGEIDELNDDNRDSGRFCSITPESLVEDLVLKGKAFFQTPGITIRRRLLDRTGLFDIRFKVAEDIHLWLKIAASARLADGSAGKPVGVVRRHQHHSWTGLEQDYSLYFLYAVANTYAWAKSRPYEISPKVHSILRNGCSKAFREAVQIAGVSGWSSLFIKAICFSVHRIPWIFFDKRLLGDLRMSVNKLYGWR